MTRVNRALLSLIIAAGMCTPILAQPTKEKPAEKPAPAAAAPAKAQPEKGAAPANPQLPPGMTEEDMKDMQTCMEAGTPGPMHQWLTSQAGTYEGKTKMWMKPGAPASDGTCHTTITPLYEGRYIKVQTNGTFPGMPPFEGQGIYGYDNVSKQFTSCWIDNMSSGIMTGTGTLSTDQKTFTLNSKYNDPITKKEVNFREIWSFKPDGGMTLEMFMPDKTGKEFKMMEITYAGKAPGKSGAAPGTDLKAKPSDSVPGKK